MEFLHVKVQFGNEGIGTIFFQTFCGFFFFRRKIIDMIFIIVWREFFMKFEVIWVQIKVLAFGRAFSHWRDEKKLLNEKLNV